MGRLVLLTAALAALLTAGCDPSGPPGVPGQAGDAHGQLTCGSCHEYTLATRSQLAVDRLVNADSMARHAPVPEATCTAGGCHPDAGPREVEFRSVSFEHRKHGGDTVVAMGCVGCHTHDEGGAPLTAGLDPCSLCHLGEQSAGNSGECRQCHNRLDHVSTTSQGLPVPHEELPWLDGGCVRCHYDVTRARVEVSVLKCRSCHTDEDRVVARGIGEDLHGAHVAVGCLSCHEGEAHRIRAMSSAVELECAECHRRTHRVDVSPRWPERATCNACHPAAHAQQQQMVLGLVPELPGSNPSVKFLSGLTCASCHQVALSPDLSEPVGATPRSCQGCHPDEYATVLRWWQEGAGERIARIRTHLRTATEVISGPDGALALLDSARLLVDLAEVGRPEHNLLLSHEMMARSADLVTDAYLVAGQAAPAPPTLGREPHDGLCSYCHYRSNDPWLFEEMSGAFHREALGLRTRR